MSHVESEQITFECQDKYQLTGTLFKPKGDLKAAVVIGPATGIKRQFYRHFATYLAEHGYGVLTFDNRGIGQSLVGHVRESKASLQCWGEQDLPAALTALISHFPGVPYHLVGHSAGGQLIGLMNNADQLSSMYTVASSSGRLSNMKMPYWFKAQFFMNLFIPLNNLLFGHTKSQLVGMGEPLPQAVADQWRQWCNGQGYVKTAFGHSITTHYYDQLTLPTMWVNATDDDIANQENLADMLSVFKKIKVDTLTVSPQKPDLAEIGHMKFFSRKSQTLWPHALTWFHQHNGTKNNSTSQSNE
ncbi:MAG: alpha/beta fold hydrolase [Gammaproteobacteria bacterium]|nr:alpha/beta fold hydrolase [Gammaproteobacteria bacterium]